MAKEINSLNMEKRVWLRLDEQARVMKSSRSEICERMFAEAFGMLDLLPLINAHKLRVPEKKQ